MPVFYGRKASSADPIKHARLEQVAKPIKCGSGATTELSLACNGYETEDPLDEGRPRPEADHSGLGRAEVMHKAQDVTHEQLRHACTMWARNTSVWVNCIVDN